ncbi:MAG: hypothetical protein ACREBW_04820 [Candidatus Micrarchaeaceae archaeon]
MPAQPEQISPPDTLYRGIIMPAHEVDEKLYTADLVPGTKKIAPNGEAVVADGNEYGVYMTDNVDAAAGVHGAPKHGDKLPGSPAFSYHGDRRAHLDVPRVGVVYEISTKGLNVRPPKLQPQWSGGQYNSGWSGKEWLVEDKVPVSHHTMRQLTVGSDLLHPVKHFVVESDPEKAIEAVQDEVRRRVGRLALLSIDIGQLTTERRRNEFAVAKVVQAHKSRIATEERDPVQ